MTYRVGHHSTSDDWKAYRPEFEVDNLGTKNCPIMRVKSFLYNEELWTPENDAVYAEKVYFLEIMRSLFC